MKLNEQSHRADSTMRVDVMKWRLDDGQIEIVDDAVAEVLRRKTMTERVAMVFAANRTMRLVIEGHLRSLHPDWPDEKIAAEVVRRMALGTA